MNYDCYECLRLCAYNPEKIKNFNHDGICECKKVVK